MTAWSALFCVIKGDTAHFEYISLAATTGLMNASLATGVPLTFGILTTYTDEQAIVRSRDDAYNKGREAAAACLEALATLSKVAYPSFPDTPLQALALQGLLQLSQPRAGLFCLTAGELNVISS